MKFLLINFSPREDMCTFRALREIEKTLNALGHESYIQNYQNISDCINCRVCKEKGECLDQHINYFASRAKEYDGFIFGSPVYYGGINANAKAFLTKLFYSYPKLLMFKPIGCVVSSRRAGSVAALQEFYLPFLMHSCYITGSQYWCEVHGDTPEEVELDYEGLQTMRTLALNMIYIAESLNMNIKNMPIHEEKRHLNFISREYQALINKE